MSDPSRDPSAPMTRRQAREAARSGRASARPADAGPHITGPAATGEETPGETRAGRQDAGQPMEWDRILPAPRPAGTATERSEPATLAETAARAEDTSPQDGHASSSLEDLFVPDAVVEPKRRRRGGGCLAVLVILVVILGGITAAGFWAWNTYGTQIAERLGWDGPSDYEPGEATGEAIITIEEGDGGEAISRTLYEAGVTLKPDSFYDHLVSVETIPTFYPGVYKLQKKMTSEAALEWLQRPETRLENAVALQEGWTVRATLEAAAAGLDMPLEELQAAAEDPSAYGVEADSLEGWLFPAHYTFDPGVTAEQVVKTMVDRTRQSLASAGVAEEDAQRILTVASIVQREGRTAEDFRMVSRVIYNRLNPEISDTDGKLQMDSTAQYGYRAAHPDAAEQESVFSTEEQLNDPNPWNTYVHPGLPAGPIANPGDDAIAAAAAPADGAWQYFVTVNLDTGETVFSETYAEQQAAEARLHAWCGENPGHAGCG